MSGKNIFNSIKVNKPNSNVFDLTHDVKLTLQMGQLTPVCAFEAIPGDKFNIGCESLLRFMPLVAPVMHRFDVTVHYFFVPNRILWPNWEKWMADPNAAFAAPYIEWDNSLSAADQKLGNYLGLPFPISPLPDRVSALPFAAYQKIYNDYYRDQNLITEVITELVDGDNAALVGDLLPLRNRAWEHDYFTSCLPTPQQGASVDIPLGNVVLDPDWVGGVDPNAPFFTEGNGSVITGGVQNDAGGPHIPIAGAGVNAYDPDGTLQTEPTTINELRMAMRLQEWLEKQMRGGKRYIEQILMHFGVRSSDARLNRPEYITGIKSPVVVSEVLNTTGEAAGLPQGNMAGHAFSTPNGKYGKYFCEEHGWIIGIMSVMPKTAYQQGIARQFTKFDQFDHYWPSFAHIGEQAVLNKEIFAGTGSAGDDPFGYVPRYSEYRFVNNRVAGEMTNTLDYWHAGRIFSGAPALNQSFIECVPADADRIFAVNTGDDNIVAHVVNKVSAVRRVSKWGTPTL